MAERSVEQLLEENRELRAQLQEAEQALEAIQSGEVDAFLCGDDQLVASGDALKPYQAFVEQMQQGAVSLSLDGTILYANMRFAEIIGRPLEKAIGANFVDLAMNQALARALLKEAELGSSRGELLLEKPGHAGVPAFVAIQRMEESGGPDFCMVVTDLTDIVAARLLTSELETRVEERTRALVAKNQELEGFTYSVSHDMRTPLRAIVSNAAIVVEEEGERLSGAGSDRLQRLSDAAIKMAQLVDDLLQYARIGVRELRKAPTSLTELARTVAGQVASEHQGFELNVTVPEETTANVDPRILGMALHNLFDNAGKYRKAGEPARVEFGMENRFGERVFFVRDQGIGFDMSYVHKLFVPFERLHRDADYKGTGIGLANVKRAVDRHNGVVWAEGELGKGATFYFTLGNA